MLYFFITFALFLMTLPIQAVKLCFQRRHVPEILQRCRILRRADNNAFLKEAFS